MGEVTLHIAGRPHVVACRDGEEAALDALVHRIERHVPAAQRAAGGGPARTMLFIALLLADELGEADALAGIAGRLEALADALENVDQAA